jgi:hypothetical protein
MRVGVLTQWFEPETGAAAHPTAVAKALEARGHDVRVLLVIAGWSHLASPYSSQGLPWSSVCWRGRFRCGWPRWADLSDWSSWSARFGGRGW